MTPAVAPADKGGLAWCKGGAAGSDPARKDSAADAIVLTARTVP